MRIATSRRTRRRQRAARTAPRQLNALEAELAGDSGELGADALRAELYEGRLDGHALIDAHGETPAVDFRSGRPRPSDCSPATATPE